MAKQPINNHKRMAMGGNARGYAMGGPVLPSQAQATLPPQAGGAMRPAMPTQSMRPPMPAQGVRPGLKMGGGVKPALLKTGMPDSPLTKSKAANGIPGMKKGGKC